MFSITLLSFYVILRRFTTLPCLSRNIFASGMNFGDNVQIKGCSVKARHLESSSGNSSIDSLIGGALPNTSITIVDETLSRVYADTLARYFIAEGLYNDHDILVVDPSSSTSDLWTSIPSRGEVNTDAPANSGLPSAADGMKIAWRYGATPQVNSAIGTKNRYDLRKPIDNFGTFASVRHNASAPCKYQDVYDLLKRLISSDLHSKTRSPKKNLLRVVIRHLGSPLWSDPERFSTFLAHLQMMTRESYVIVMATCCTTSIPQPLVRELEVTSDLFIRLVAMTDEEKKLLPSLDKFHGYFNIVSFHL